MKKIKYLSYGILLFFVGILVSNAASLKVSANKSTVVVGSTVTITVNASGAAGWEYCLNYNSSIFQLTSTTSDSGGKCVLTGSTLGGFSKVTFTLKAIKRGSATISLDKAFMYNDNGDSISFSKNTVKLTTKTQAEIEASYSTDADLKSLGVEGYDLSPSFDKNTTSYKLEVGNEVDKIVINASKSDSSASMSGTGEKNLTEGINVFKVVVTAEKGNKKTYTIEVTRKELNPINVEVNNQEMSVVRKIDALEVPAYYSSTEIEYQNETIPALKSDITGFVLVGLKDEEGNINLYVFDNVTNVFKEYKQVGMDGFTFVSLEPSELIKGYESTKNIEIEDLTINAYYNSDNEMVLVYGMNAKTGETSWYKYDEKEGTFQRYIANKVVNVEDKNDLYFILAIVFACGLGLAIIILIVIMRINSDIRKKNNKLISILQSKQEEELRNKAKLLEEEKEKEDKVKEKKTKKKKEEVKEEQVTEEVEEEETSEVTAEDSEETSEVTEEEKQPEELSQRELRRIEKQKEKELAEIQESNKKVDILDGKTEEIVIEKASRSNRSKKRKK